jgi:DNA-binding FadR family transcriptional regulator
MARSNAKLGPIPKRKLSDEVLARLESAIRNGTYAPGSSLPPERELMALFGVGRPSVREALYSLQKLGLVQIVSGERPKVLRPSPKHLLNELGSTAKHLLEQPDGLRHFEQARLALELFLVRFACQAASDAQIEHLAEALRANERAIGRQAEFVATDVAFHRVLAEMPGNPIFIAMHDAVVEWIIDQRPPLEDPEPNNRMSFAGHVAVFQAVTARDAEAATKAMQQHLGDAYNRYAAN